MAIAMAIVAYMVLTGCAFLFVNCFRVKIMEGFVLSLGLIEIVLVGSAVFFHNFIYGIYGIWGLAGFGAAISVYHLVREKQNMLSRMKNSIAPEYIMLTIIFAVSLFLYHDGTIHLGDEFHQWAPAVRHMLFDNRFPNATDQDVVNTGYYYSSGLFHLFFWEHTGYQEGILYVSAALLKWIGFLLPFSNANLKNRNAVWGFVAYVVLIYLSMYSLYYYGIKNFMTDLPAAAWLGGGIAWVVGKMPGKKDVFPIVTIAGVLFFVKPYIGPLMSLYFIGTTLLYLWLYGPKDKEVEEERKRWFPAYFVVGCIIFGVFLLLHYYDQQFLLSVYKLKTLVIISSYVKALFLKPLAVSSRIQICFAPFILGLAVLFFVVGWLQKFKNRWKFLIFIFAGILFSYLSLLYYAYLEVFNFQESESLGGMARYLSVCAISIFVVVLCYPFSDSKLSVKNTKYVTGLYVTLVILAALQLQNNALNSYTFYDEDYYVSLIQIQEAKSECDKLQDVLSEGEKVYIINQSGETRPMNVFAYYLNGICNSYLYEPWMFYDGGVKIRGWDNTGLNMDVLTFMLAVGSYDYIYVYEKDAYLEEQLREMYGLESLEERVLYRVVQIGDHFYLNRAYNIQE